MSIETKLLLIWLGLTWIFAIVLWMFITMDQEEIKNEKIANYEILKNCFWHHYEKKLIKFNNESYNTKSEILENCKRKYYIK